MRSVLHVIMSTHQAGQVEVASCPN